jgi:hypothetical protein
VNFGETVHSDVRKKNYLESGVFFGVFSKKLPKIMSNVKTF